MKYILCYFVTLLNTMHNDSAYVYNLFLEQFILIQKLDQLVTYVNSSRVWNDISLTNVYTNKLC